MPNLECIKPRTKTKNSRERGQGSIQVGPRLGKENKKPPFFPPSEGVTFIS